MSVHIMCRDRIGFSIYGYVGAKREKERKRTSNRKEGKRKEGG